VTLLFPERREVVDNLLFSGSNFSTFTTIYLERTVQTKPSDGLFIVKESQADGVLMSL
jgi:hypothetical protein